MGSAPISISPRLRSHQFIGAERRRRPSSHLGTICQDVNISNCLQSKSGRPKTRKGACITECASISINNTDLASLCSFSSFKRGATPSTPCLDQGPSGARSRKADKGRSLQWQPSSRLNPLSPLDHPHTPPQPGPARHGIQTCRPGPDNKRPGGIHAVRRVFALGAICYIYPVSPLSSRNESPASFLESRLFSSATEVTSLFFRR